MNAMTPPPLFPFVALVGLDMLKLALQLAAIDSRLSVLVRGDKGAGKTTAARGLAALLAPGARFVTLPIGATEDRLLGGLDLERALKGAPALKPGVLADAHGGVLYIDEVNLLPDHLADALLDASASGMHVVEREGFSVTQSTDFLMVGSMNPEEGALRPQLLDRFALAVDVEAPLDPHVRSDVLERRLRYDTDAAGFMERWSHETTLTRQTLADARNRVADLTLSRELLQYIATRVAERGVRSLRADLAVMRASRACAALERAAMVEREHVERVLPLALAHRSHDRDRTRPSPSQLPAQHAADNADGQRRGESASAAERIFAPADVPAAPRLLIDRASAPVHRGPVIGTRLTPDPRELDARPTLLHAVTRNNASVTVQPDDLHEKLRAARGHTRFIVIIDSSGSHAVHERMTLVKGTITALLDASHTRHDELVLIVCRGATGSVLLEPTTSREDVTRALEYLPTGGRTPLAHALELAANYVTDHALLLLITDGHANVPHHSEDPWADTLTAAHSVCCPALLIDSEDPTHATARPHELAQALRATYTRLSDLDHAAVLRLVSDRPR